MKNTLRFTEEEIAAEIERLHQFFIDWFNGVVPKTEEAYTPFSSATSGDFNIVTPHGTIIPIAALAESLYGAHNHRPGLDIKVKNMQVQQDMGEFCLATYEEWQLEKGNTEWKGRTSTALLSRNDSAPAGLMWHHVHETWME